MKLALLATILLASLLTSACGASALDNHEDDGGYGNMLIKRFSSENSSGNSPPTPPHLGLRRGNRDSLVQGFREKREREKRKQAAAVPSRRKWSTSRKPVRLARGSTRGIKTLSDDFFDQPDDEEMDDEETDDEETQSDFWSTKRRQAPKRIRTSFRPPMSNIVDETALDARKQQRGQQRSNKRRRKVGEIRNKISLTPAQIKMLKSDARFEEYQKLRRARFHRAEVKTAQEREKRRRRFEERKLFDAPLSYQNLEPKDLEALRKRLKRLVKHIEAIKSGDAGKGKSQLIELWTQEDLEWWNGYIKFRQEAEAPLPGFERLVHAIDTFFANGKGKKKMPAALENAVSGGFRPPEAYQEALVARRKALRNTVQAMVA
ncbi:hypothetical protein FA10DRAFT_295464 [Acaromyces ingoldii]|uniref:Uncharacterized protein n=1 Tax=Acaromyces ingoldii TaxID=215250 RepID=A0A316YJE0_9BASI|nr:hypothetical protein FA10DRAFT_295464 [Acaromyces ingoldii]PWN89650.1 hypothetical protein FA10DRAFT_295464 [Acaromyces ingoldii]